MLFIIMAVIAIYMGIGMTIERNRYALANYKAKAFIADDKFYQEEYDKALGERNRIPHKSYCYTTINKTYGCQNCTDANEATWRDTTQRMKEAKAKQSKLPAAKVEPKNIFLWWIYLAGVWVKSGEPKNSVEYRRAKEIEEAEHDAKMAEIRAREAAALDAELKALDLPSSV